MSKDAHYTNEKNALERMLEIGSGVNDYREYAGNKVKDVLEEVVLCQDLAQNKMRSSAS